MTDADGYIRTSKERRVDHFLNIALALWRGNIQIQYNPTWIEFKLRAIEDPLNKALRERFPVAHLGYNDDPYTNPYTYVLRHYESRGAAVEWALNAESDIFHVGFVKEWVARPRVLFTDWTTFATGPRVIMTYAITPKRNVCVIPMYTLPMFQEELAGQEEAKVLINALNDAIVETISKYTVVPQYSRDATHRLTPDMIPRLKRLISRDCNIHRAPQYWTDQPKNAEEPPAVTTDEDLNFILKKGQVYPVVIPGRQSESEVKAEDRLHWGEITGLGN